MLDFRKSYPNKYNLYQKQLKNTSRYPRNYKFWNLVSMFLLVFTVFGAVSFVVIDFNQSNFKQASAGKAYLNKDPLNPPSIAADDTAGLELGFRYGTVSSDTDIVNAFGNLSFDTTGLEFDINSFEDRYNTWANFPAKRYDSQNPPAEVSPGELLCIDSSSSIDLTTSVPKNKIKSSLATVSSFTYGFQSARGGYTAGGVSDSNDSSYTGSLQQKHTGCIRFVVKPKYCTPQRGLVTITYDRDFENSPSYQQGNAPDTGEYKINITEPADPNNCTSNQSPILVKDLATTTKNTAVTINVLNNDSDSDGTLNKSTLTVATAPTKGTTTVNTTDGTITYTPNTDIVGTDSFVYSIQDNEKDASTATVEITIEDTGSNQPPVAVDDTATTSQNTMVSIDVTGNDSDPDGSVVLQTVKVVDQPASGSTNINNGMAEYTPNTDYVGTDTFTYTVQDNQGQASNLATVTVTVSASTPTDKPIAVDDLITTTVNNAITISVLTNDKSNPDTIGLNTSTLSVVDYASKGTTNVQSNGQIIYTPNTDYVGTDTFTYTIKDNQGQASNKATVTITINADSPRIKPVAVNDTRITEENKPVTIEVVSNDKLDSLAKLDEYTLEIVSQPLNGSAEISQTTKEIAYTPDNSYSGADSFSYQLLDNITKQKSNEAVISITINKKIDSESQKPNLLIVKTVDTKTITQGESSNLTYTIDYSNNGKKEASKVVVADNLNPNYQFVSCDGDIKCDSSSLPDISWEVGTLSAGTSGTVSLVVSVSSEAPVGNISNRATISSPDIDNVPESLDSVAIIDKAKDNNQNTDNTDASDQIILPRTGGGGTAFIVVILALIVIGIYAIYFSFYPQSKKTNKFESYSHFDNLK